MLQWCRLQSLSLRDSLSPCLPVCLPLFFSRCSYQPKNKLSLLLIPKSFGQQSLHAVMLCEHFQAIYQNYTATWDDTSSSIYPCCTRLVYASIVSFLAIGFRSIYYRCPLWVPYDLYSLVSALWQPMPSFFLMRIFFFFLWYR